jgi:hypothetical protein
MTTSSNTLSLSEYNTSSFDIGSDYSPEYYVRQLILESVRKESLITSFYQEQLRNILSLFNNIVIQLPDKSIKNVKCVPGSPERTIAKLNKDTLVVLPIIAVDQTQTTEEAEQRRYTPLITSEKYWDNDKQRAIRVVSLVPKAVSIEYDISVWTKFKEDMDQITEQIQRMFHPSMDVNTPFTKYGKIFLASEQNMSSLEAGDGEDRLLNKLFGLKVETHIPYPKFLMTSTGKIERIYLEGGIYTKPRTS